MPLSLGFILFVLGLGTSCKSSRACSLVGWAQCGADTVHYLIKLYTRLVSFDILIRMVWGSLKSYISPFVVNMHLVGMQDMLLLSLSSHR